MARYIDPSPSDRQSPDPSMDETESLALHFEESDDPLLKDLNTALAIEGEWHRGPNQIPGTKYVEKFRGDPFYLAPEALKFARRAAGMGKSAVVQTIVDKVDDWGVHIEPAIHNTNAQLLARAGKLKPALSIVLKQIARAGNQESGGKDNDYIEAFNAVLGIKDLSSLLLETARSVIQQNANRLTDAQKQLLGAIESQIQKLNDLKINDSLPHDEDHPKESKNIITTTIVSAWEQLYYAGEHRLAGLIESIDTTAAQSIMALREKIDAK